VSKTSRELLRTKWRRLKEKPERRPEPPEVDPVHPEVVEEHTNVGPEMDAIVTRAKRKQRPLGLDPDYDLLRENFDHLEFMLQASTLNKLPDADPIEQFLRKGQNARTTPNHNFSMSNYLARYPEKKDGPERSPYLEWIKRGRDAGEIADPGHGIEQLAPVLGLDPQQVVDELVATRDDVMQRLWTGKLGVMLAKAAEIEPLVAAAWPETLRLRQLPLHAKQVAAAVSAIHACQQAAGFRTARLLIVTAGPRRGDGSSPERGLAHAVTEAISPDDIVVIYTDQGGESSPGRFPAGVREIDFASVVSGVPGEIKQLALTALLRSFHADSIVNHDSELMYQALEPYGKALTVSERLFLYFTGNRQQVLGNWDGWSLRWFYSGLDLPMGLITDSEGLRDELADRHQLSDDDRARIHVLSAAAEPGYAAALLFPDPESTEVAP
jgi:hypothetical protein